MKFRMYEHDMTRALEKIVMLELRKRAKSSTTNISISPLPQCLLDSPRPSLTSLVLKTILKNQPSTYSEKMRWRRG